MMNTLTSLLAPVALVLVAISPVAGVPQEGAASAVPPPGTIIGHELGAGFTSHAGIERYLGELARTSDRVKLTSYGTTYEGRTLMLAIVTSPGNHARLEEIRNANLALTDPRTGSKSAADSIAASNPAIVWLSYGVHGNEASSPEAALDVLYNLATGRDSSTLALLDGLVILIDPLLNPDGHERYVNYQIMQTGRRPRTDERAVEHNEGWPSGRTNHYFFDLNRDWAWLTQAESRARIAAYLRWMPQVHVDFHEMWHNSSYFFFPAVKPMNRNLPPATEKWGAVFGRGNAEAFDREGWHYWTGDAFDLFYPGYGDSWPSLQGAIGMTYEQGGQSGVTIRREDGTDLTLRERLRHHSAASFSTMKTAVGNRRDLLRDFTRFFRDAVAEGREGPVRSYLIPPGNDPARSAKLAGLLISQGVEVHRTAAAVKVGDARSYMTPMAGSREFPAGTYVVPLDQPAKRLILALMEKEPAISDTAFYDISAWSLPLAYGVEVWWSGTSLRPGEALESAAAPAGGVTGAPARYAYLFPGNTNSSIKAINALLRDGYRVHSGLMPFTLDGAKHGRGTVIVPVGGQKPGLHERIRVVAESLGISVVGAATGFTEEGMSLGSDRAVLLKKPRVAVATGEPVSVSSYGAIWSLFDNEYGLDFTPIRTSELQWADLHDYDVLILPDDGAGGRGYAATLDSSDAEKLGVWISSGGTCIGIEGGAVFASAAHAGLSSTKLKSRKKPEDEKKDGAPKDGKKDGLPQAQTEEEKEEARRMMTVEERVRKRRLDDVPGTILRVRIDTTHPLGFGYDTLLTVFKSSSRAFELSGGFNVGIYPKSPRLSGYMSAENEEFVGKTPYLIHERKGEGNVILFADDPNFRLFWDALNRIFLNAVLIMPAVESVEMAAGGRH